MKIFSTIYLHMIRQRIWDEGTHESMRCKTLREIWNGEKFVAFRKRKKEKCGNCGRREICQDGCRLGINIELC